MNVDTLEALLNGSGASHLVLNWLLYSRVDEKPTSGLCTTRQVFNAANVVSGSLGNSAHCQWNGRSFASGPPDTRLRLPLCASCLSCHRLDDWFDFVVVDSEAGRNVQAPIAWQWLSNYCLGNDFPLLFNDIAYVLVGTAVNSLAWAHLVILPVRGPNVYDLRLGLSDRCPQHGFPGRLIVSDADQFASAHQRQAQQRGVSLDPPH